MLFTIKRSAVKKAPVSLNAHRGLLFYCGLVAGLGQRSGIFKAVHRGYPNGVRRLPLVEVLAADIGAVDDLIVVARQQVGRQNAVVVQVGLEHDPVIRPLQDMKNPHRRKEEQ